MKKKLLQKSDIREGKFLLLALDAGKINITDAFWLYDSESLDWQLMFASPLVDKDGPLAAYREALNEYTKIAKDIPGIDFCDIKLISPKDLKVVFDGSIMLREIKTSARAVEEIRFAGGSVEDCLIYRMT